MSAKPAIVLCTVALLAPCLAPATAGGDADPASDVLLTQSVFYPYSAQVSAQVQKTLNQATARARRAGFPIKVALIERPLDLGGVFELFGKPKAYAKFLDTEISFRTLQPVLVVMPTGLGGSGLGSAATATLAALPPPPGRRPNALAQAAITDVTKLAAAAGHPITAAASPTSATSGGPGAAPLVGIAIALVIIALAVVTLRDRRRAARR